MSKPSILIVNDDGLHGPGLAPLARAMRGLGRVTIVVPDQERSADSHSLTLHKPLRVRRVSPDFYIINGSPADCTRFAVLELLRARVDLVASGINHGLNMGEDVVYSGTVAGAMEAVILDVPSIAFSHQRPPSSGRPPGPDALGRAYGASARWARSLAAQVLRRGLPKGTCLNVNFPWTGGSGPKPPVATRLGRRIYSQVVARRADPRGELYFWLAGKTVRASGERGTDVSAIARGHVSVTPLKIDNTDAETLASLKDWGLEE